MTSPSEARGWISLFAMAVASCGVVLKYGLTSGLIFFGLTLLVYCMYVGWLSKK